MKRTIFFASLCLVFQFKMYSNTNSIVLLPYMEVKPVFELVKKIFPKEITILEAGAYTGDETITMNNFWPKSKIYTFEPDPIAYKDLKSKIKSYKNIKAYPIALGEKDGIAKFYPSKFVGNSEAPGASGSLLKPKEHITLATFVEFKNEIDVKTMTLDSWAKKYNIKSIDFLWLDMQGFELIALQHGTNILKTTKVIYTEVEFKEAYANQPLFTDVKNWLNQQGFELIAIDVELKNDKPINKEYWFGNALFIRKMH